MLYKVNVNINKFNFMKLYMNKILFNINDIIKFISKTLGNFFENNNDNFI